MSPLRGPTWSSGRESDFVTCSVTINLIIVNLLLDPTIC